MPDNGAELAGWMALAALVVYAGIFVLLHFLPVRRQR